MSRELQENLLIVAWLPGRRCSPRGGKQLAGGRRAAASLLVCWLTLAGIGPAPTWAQTLDDFIKSSNQCWDLIDAGNYVDAEKTAIKLRRMAETQLVDRPACLASAFYTLGIIHYHQGRYALAEPFHKQALGIYRKTLGEEHPQVAVSLSTLGLLYVTLGRFAEAEPLYRQVLEISRKTLGIEHPSVAISLSTLGLLYRDQGRFTEAETLHRQALEINCKALGNEDPRVAASLNSLALLYASQGRFGEAEPLYRQALEIRRKALGNEHPDVAACLGSLAVLYHKQGRFTEAEPLYWQALEIRRKVLGNEHPDVAACLNNLMYLYYKQGRFTEAEPLLDQAEKIAQGGLCDPQLVANLGALYGSQGRFGEAEPLHRQALDIRRKVLGNEHPSVAACLNNLSNLYYKQGRFTEAEPLLDQAEKIAQSGLCDPQLVARIRWSGARLAWSTERPQEAVAKLKEAWRAIESQRVLVVGGDLERSQFFADWKHLFERMVAWQEELGDSAEIGEALEAMERGRARMLLDQINGAGLDLLAGVPEDEAQRLRRREVEAWGKEVSFRKQLELLPARWDLGDDQRADEQKRLMAALRDARAEYAAADAAIRGASPAYRLAVGADLEPVALEGLAKYVDRQEGLLLEYLLGAEGSYVLVVPAGGLPHVAALMLDEAQAKQLGVEPGPLTAERMRAILMGEEQTGVLDQLRASNDPRREQKAAEGLALLWELLVPTAQREAILEGRYERLIVVPDTALALLPFETLVVESGEQPKYLLDVGPPIVYAPSATILLNLAARQEAARQPAEQPVLSIGDCRHGRSAEPSGMLLAGLAPQTRYTAVGGHLEPLKCAAWEVQWVGDVFRKRGAPAAQLCGDAARELSVSQYAPGRRVLHFATHGLVDQQYGNLFGALALTPGPRPENPADDGFLTLAEIYELDLKGCELAILSACDTNVGPEQRGEGVYALSRGFLTAGVRRVVASSWLLDDEVAASTVSYFCAGVAQQQASAAEVDYAAALHEAKRWARSVNTEKHDWSSPYYWAPMVLIGPQ